MLGAGDELPTNRSLLGNGSILFPASTAHELERVDAQKSHHWRLRLERL
jgi:hypothetical protein